MNHNPRRKLVLAGGSGFLGRLLIEHFDAAGWEVVVLTRQPSAAVAPARTVHWDGATVGEWANELEGADAVVNLAGRSVNCRYHERNRRAILASRVDSTRALGRAIAACHVPPRVWLNTSTATIYRHSYDRAMDELTGVIGGSPEAKDAFSVEVAEAWEEAFAAADAPRTRKVALRVAMVLSTHRGSVFRVLRRLVRLGLGGAMAGGQQYVSWLHEVDYCRAIEWLIERDDLTGAVNLAAPRPLTNADMMRTLRRGCGVRIGLPATRWMLEVGALLLRTETELVIKSRRVVPVRLLGSGFAFRFPTFAAAVDELEPRVAGARQPRTPGRAPESGVARQRRAALAAGISKLSPLN